MDILSHAEITILRAAREILDSVPGRTLELERYTQGYIDAGASYASSAILHFGVALKIRTGDEGFGAIYGEVPAEAPAEVNAEANGAGLELEPELEPELEREFAGEARANAAEHEAASAYADWRGDRIDTETYEARLAAVGYRRTWGTEGIDRGASYVPLESAELEPELEAGDEAELEAPELEHGLGRVTITEAELERRIDQSVQAKMRRDARYINAESAEAAAEAEAAIEAEVTAELAARFEVS